MDKRQKSSTGNLKTVAIIPAAGAGVRMGGDQAKQFLDLEGRPLLAVTLEKFQVSPVIDGIILVVPPNEVARVQKGIVDPYNLTKVKEVIAGGKERQDSVRLGIEATKSAYGLVLIHDGVRPLVSLELIGRVVAAARKHRAVITGSPAKETVKEVDKGGRVVKTYDRERVWLVQTPQIFRYEDIHAAHQRAVEQGWKEAPDDALLVEKMGIPVTVIEGSENNIKITTPHDLKLARFLLNRDK